MNQFSSLTDSERKTYWRGAQWLVGIVFVLSSIVMLVADKTATFDGFTLLMLGVMLFNAPAFIVAYMMFPGNVGGGGLWLCIAVQWGIILFLLHAKIHADHPPATRASVLSFVKLVAIIMGTCALLAFLYAAV